MPERATTQDREIGDGTKTSPVKAQNDERHPMIDLADPNRQDRPAPQPTMGVIASITPKMMLVRNPLQGRAFAQRSGKGVE
jgi:hypothetical protein